MNNEEEISAWDYMAKFYLSLDKSKPLKDRLDTLYAEIQEKYSDKINDDDPSVTFMDILHLGLEDYEKEYEVFKEEVKQVKLPKAELFNLYVERLKNLRDEKGTIENDAIVQAIDAADINRTMVKPSYFSERFAWHPPIKDCAVEGRIFFSYFRSEDLSLPFSKKQIVEAASVSGFFSKRQKRRFIIIYDKAARSYHDLSKKFPIYVDFPMWLYNIAENSTARAKMVGFAKFSGIALGIIIFVLVMNRCEQNFDESQRRYDRQESEYARKAMNYGTSREKAKEQYHEIQREIIREGQR